MADEKLSIVPNGNKPPEISVPPGTDDPPTQGQAVIPGMENETIPQPASGEVVVDFEKINELMAQRRSAAQAVVEKAGSQPTVEDSTSKRRGRPPKEQAGVSAGKKEKAAEPRTGRPSKVDKAAREEAPPSVLDKVSRGKKADKGKETGSGGAPVSKTAKNGVYPFQNIKPLIEKILKTVISDGKGIEVNTSSYRYGLSDTTPSMDILKLYRELGGKIITIGSDSHKPEHLGAYIKETKELLKRLGYTQFCTYKNMSPIFHDL